MKKALLSVSFFILCLFKICIFAGAYFTLLFLIIINQQEVFKAEFITGITPIELFKFFLFGLELTPLKNTLNMLNLSESLLCDRHIIKESNIHIFITGNPQRKSPRKKLCIIPVQNFLVVLNLVNEKFHSGLDVENIRKGKFKSMGDALSYVKFTDWQVNLHRNVIINKEPYYYSSIEKDFENTFLLFSQFLKELSKYFSEEYRDKFFSFELLDSSISYSTLEDTLYHFIENDTVNEVLVLELRKESSLFKQYGKYLAGKVILSNSEIEKITENVRLNNEYIGDMKIQLKDGKVVICKSNDTDNVITETFFNELKKDGVIT